MNSQSPRDRLLQRRLRALAEALPAARTADAGAVHKARVASRRVRETIPVVLAQGPPRKVRRLRRSLRRVTRALGPVRELDVSIERVASLAAADPGPAHATALDWLRRRLETERLAMTEEMLGRLEGIDAADLASRFVRALDAALDDDTEEQAEEESRGVLAVRVVRRGKALRHAIDHAGALYAPEPLHQVRIAVKKMRYSLELAHELRLLPTRRAITRLRLLQDTLGDLHDLQVLVTRIGGAQASLPVGERGLDDALTAITDTIDARCRQLHANYVAARARALIVVDEAVDAVAARPEHPEDVAPASHSVH